MKKPDIKKLTALCCAAALASGLTGCGENTTWSAEIDGKKIPAGVLIYYLDNYTYQAKSKYSEENPVQFGADGDIIENPPIYTCTVEGIPAKQWVYDHATTALREYAAIEKKFDEYGLSLTESEKNSQELYFKQMWEYSEEYYTSHGVSESSFKAMINVADKKDKVFEHLYSEGGEYAVPEEEIKTYIDENYAMINYIRVDLKDGEGNLLKSDGVEERRKMLEDYITRYNSGEDFDKLNAEYQAFYDDLVEKASENAAEVETSPAQAPAADEEEEIDPEETEDEEASETEAETEAETEPVTEAVTEATTAETTSMIDSVPNFSDVDAADYPSNQTVIEKSDGETPCKEVADRVFGGMEKNAPEIIETENGETLYLVVKLDIAGDEYYYNAAKSSVIYEMKADDFKAVVTSWVDEQSFVKNQEAYDRYDPEKLFG